MIKHTVKATQKQIRPSIERTYSWECPMCADRHESLPDATVSEFLAQLKEEGVQGITTKHMTGVFCWKCINDPEIEEVSL